MAISTYTDTDPWLAKARALAGVIEQHRDESERQRYLSPAIVRAMRDAGLFNAWLPRAFDGHAASIRSGLLAIEEVARHDGAAAWNLIIGMSGGLFADYLPEAAARDIYGHGDTLVAGSFAPIGRAIAVDGGYRLSGRWPFASGCHQANWMIAGAPIVEGGVPRPTPQGVPGGFLFLLPASDCRIIDTWSTGGMRGTGSHDYEVADVLVPAERCFPFADLFVGPPERPSRAYPHPFMLIAALGLAGVGLGVARDAIDSFRALAEKKTPSGALSTLITHPLAHDQAGRAAALLGSARAYLYEAVDALAETREATDEVSALVRLASTHAAHACADAVSLMYEAGGGSSIYNSSRLDRCFRDAHTLTHHIQLSQSNYEMVGQFVLGMPLRARRG